MRPSTRKTPYEIGKGKKPSLNHLHVFGCTFYILNDREQLGKFEVKSDKGVFLSYSPNSHAYRIYKLRTKTIMESINMVVDNFNDSAGISREDDAICLIYDAKTQLQKMIVTPYVATLIDSDSTIETIDATNSTMEVVTKIFDIIDPITRDLPTRIQKDHPTENIISDVIDGIKTRDKRKRNYLDMVRYVCYNSSN